MSVAAFYLHLSLLIKFTRQSDNRHLLFLSNSLKQLSFMIKVCQCR